MQKQYSVKEELLQEERKTKMDIKTALIIEKLKKSVPVQIIEYTTDETGKYIIANTWNTWDEYQASMKVKVRVKSNE